MKYYIAYCANYVQNILPITKKLKKSDIEFTKHY